MLFIGREHIFPWLHMDLHGKEVWLNIPFLFWRDFFGLLILYLLGFAYLFNALQLKFDPNQPMGEIRKYIYNAWKQNNQNPERIKSRMTQIYSGLAPKNGEAPNTFSQISLGQLRTIRIHVIGEAQRPGSYNVSSLSTVAHALYLSGGPNFNGSMRNIEIIRDNNMLKTEV